MDPKPNIPAKVLDFVKQWWTTTNDVPDYDVAVRAARECQKTLFPQWFDRTDRFRGNVPLELRTRKDDRRVRVQLAYKNVLQTVAMTVPDDHTYKWVPEAQVGADAGIADPTVQALADTLLPVSKSYCEEAGFQDIVQGWVQDACQYRLGIMKVVFDKEYLSDTSKIHSEGKDQQDNIQRLRALLEDFDNKRFTDQSAEYKEIEMLSESLGIDKGELKVWTGIRAELVPIDSFRVDPAIRGFEQVYQASWMSHDVQMSVDEIKTKYPFKLNEDGQTFTGAHPDDLSQYSKNNTNTSPNVPKPSYGNQEKGKGPHPVPDSKAEIDRLTVREVWARKLNKVFVMIEGIDYIIAEWVPDPTPKQWYPFRLLRLNRVTGQVYGISDVELQMEIQHRINRKRTDEEKARWLSLPRGIYNTQGIEQQEIGKMRDHNPGEWKGLNLGGAKSIKEVMEFVSFPFDVNAFNTSQDEIEMRQMSSLPQQFMGGTGGGGIKYSSEMDAAMQGAAISANSRGACIRKAVEGTYDLIAELLLQNLSPEDAMEIAGPMAFWPKVKTEQEARRILAEIDAQVAQEIQQKVQADAMMAMQQGLPAPPPPNEEQMLQTKQAGRQQKSMEAFGWETPVTRETIFRRLHCNITVAMNAQADRNQRIQAITGIFSAIQMGAQAAASCGRPFDPAPLMKLVVPLFNGDTEIQKMFGPPGMMPPGAPGGQPGLPPQVAGQNAPQAESAASAPKESTESAVKPVGPGPGGV